MSAHLHHGFMQRLLIAFVKGYRLFFSVWLGGACRFEPTCSRYALEALERHGAAGGSYLALRRVARCHPGCSGGLDPVPESVPSPFGRAARSSTADAVKVPSP